MTQRAKVVSPVSGIIKKLNANNNMRVHRGQVLVKIAFPKLHKKLHYNTYRQHKLEHYLSDLAILLKLDSASVFKKDYSLKSAKYMSSLSYFRNQLYKARKKVVMQERMYKRKKRLYTQQLISEKNMI